jgi:hypothetical protein
MFLRNVGSHKITRRHSPEDGILQKLTSLVSLFCCINITWSLTLREEQRLRVFENRLLRRIFGPKRDELTGGWRKLHNEELYNLYFSSNKIRVIKPRRMRLV